LVQVTSGRGGISYDGDFSSGGEYRFTTHTGDIRVLVPADVSADFKARSVLGRVQHDFPLKPRHSRFPEEVGRSFFGTTGQASSEVVLVLSVVESASSNANNKKIDRSRWCGARSGISAVFCAAAMRVRALFLVGFMACGKSSVGRQLAQRLDWDFVDLDTHIETRERQTIAEIFRLRGELGSVPPKRALSAS